jgi:hypothetical protein
VIQVLSFRYTNLQFALHQYTPAQMFGMHTKAKGGTSVQAPPPSRTKRTHSNADAVPARHGTKHSVPRRQLTNPVQRSPSHIKDQSAKANPINTSRPDPGRKDSAAHPSKPSSKGPPRGRGLRRNNTIQSRYTEMLLNLDTIPRMHNICASFFSWLVLAGYVVFPGTFTSLSDLSDDPDVGDRSALASRVLTSVKNVPLLVVAALCCGVGVAGILWLAACHRRNYVWLLNRLFLPSVMNGLAGLISTLITVYTTQGGDWSVTAKVSAIVEGFCAGIGGILFVLFNNLLLQRVKRKHGEAQAQVDESFLEKAERKTKEPALEPGSVV